MTELENKNISAQEGQSQSNGDYGLSPDLVFFLMEAISHGDIPRISDHIKKMRPADVADFINQISPEQREVLVAAMSQTLDPVILVDLEPDIKDEIFERLGAEKSAEAITKLQSDDAMQVIEDLERPGRKQILDAMSDKDKAEMEAGLAYPEDSAGRMMNTNYIAIPKNWNVGQTIDFFRSDEKKDVPNDFYEIFVLSKHGRPTGGVLLSRVLRSSRETPIKEIMEKGLITINANTDQEDVAYLFHKYDMVSVPVVDNNGKMVGIISVDDVVDVMEEEAEEDILHMGGITETDLHSSLIETVKKRFLWLFINLLTAVLASVVIAVFEGTIQNLVALAVLMPIVASMGGNAGIQTVTVAVRGLATKELTLTNVRRIVGKEIMVGMINGLGFALIVGVASYILYQNFELSLVFAMAMVGAMIIAGLAGVLIPIAFEKAGFDPAITSGVFLTTVTDVVGFFMFLGLASLMLM